VNKNKKPSDSGAKPDGNWEGFREVGVGSGCKILVDKQIYTVDARWFRNIRFIMNYFYLRRFLVK
jgi:hypothetical protein